MLSQGNETKVLTDPEGTKLFLKVATLSLGQDTTGIKKIFYTIAYEGSTFLVATP